MLFRSLVFSVSPSSVYSQSKSHLSLSLFPPTQDQSFFLFFFLTRSVYCFESRVKFSSPGVGEESAVLEKDEGSYPPRSAACALFVFIAEEL